jgi:hypothetical protein
MLDNREYAHVASFTQNESLNSTLKFGTPSAERSVYRVAQGSLHTGGKVEGQVTFAPPVIKIAQRRRPRHVTLCPLPVIILNNIFRWPPLLFSTN